MVATGAVLFCRAGAGNFSGTLLAATADDVPAQPPPPRVTIDGNSVSIALNHSAYSGTLHLALTELTYELQVGEEISP